MQVEWRGTDQDPDEDDFAKKKLFLTFSSSTTCSLCFPHTVRMHTRKVRVATITCKSCINICSLAISLYTSHGWVAQNSPWLRNTFLNISFSAYISKYHSIPNVYDRGNVCFFSRCFCYLTVGVSMVASLVRGPAGARALQRKGSVRLFS